MATAPGTGRFPALRICGRTKSSLANRRTLTMSNSTRETWLPIDALGRQRCRICRGNGFRFGKLRPAEACSYCGGKGFRFAAPAEGTGR